MLSFEEGIWAHYIDFERMGCAVNLLSQCRLVQMWPNPRLEGSSGSLRSPVPLRLRLRAAPQAIRYAASPLTSGNLRSILYA